MNYHSSNFGVRAVEMKIFERVIIIIIIIIIITIIIITFILYKEIGFSKPYLQY